MSKSKYESRIDNLAASFLTAFQAVQDGLAEDGVQEVRLTRKGDEWKAQVKVRREKKAGRSNLGATFVATGAVAEKRMLAAILLALDKADKIIEERVRAWENHG